MAITVGLGCLRAKPAWLSGDLSFGAFRVLLFGAFLLAGGRAERAAGQPQRLKAEELLHAHLAGQVVDRISMNVTSKCTYTPFDKDQPGEIHAEFRFLRDGERMDASGRHLYFGKWQNQSTQFRFVFDGTDWKQYDYRFAVPTSKKIIWDFPKSTKERDYFLYFPLYGGALEGYFSGSGNKPVAEHLLAAKQLELRKPEKIGGQECEVVSGATQFGRATLWIAPSLGHTVQRIELRKGADDILYGHPLSKSPPKPKAHDGQRLVGWCAVLSDVTVSKIDGKFVPVKGRLTTTDELSEQRNLIGN